MIKIKPNSAVNQQKQENKNKTANVPKQQQEDIDDDQDDNLVNIQKKDRRTRITKANITADNSWQQYQQQNPVQQSQEVIEKVNKIEVPNKKQQFNFQVTKGAQVSNNIGQDGVGIQLEDFPELGEATVQTSKKDKQKTQQKQQQQQEQQQPQKTSTSGGIGKFVNSNPSTIKKVEVQPQQQQQQQTISSPEKPIQPQIQINRGAVIVQTPVQEEKPQQLTFNNSKKNEIQQTNTQGNVEIVTQQLEIIETKEIKHEQILKRSNIQPNTQPTLIEENKDLKQNEGPKKFMNTKSNAQEKPSIPNIQPQQPILKQQEQEPEIKLHVLHEPKSFVNSQKQTKSSDKSGQSDQQPTPEQLKKQEQNVILKDEVNADDEWQVVEDVKKTKPIKQKRNK